jgi:hypothetical protein
VSTRGRATPEVIRRLGKHGLRSVPIR